MNLQDRFFEFVLPICDWALDLVTLGFWSHMQGGRRVAYLMKEQDL